MAKGITNSGSGSLTKSIIIVTDLPTGSTVTATKGDVVKTSREKNGEWWFKNLDLGEWTLRATLGDQSATTKFNIEQFGVYYVSMSYFKATISVTYPAGSTCTCTKDEKAFTAPDTSGRYDFVVDSAGEWTVSCTDEKKTQSKNVEITEKDQRVELTLSYILYIFKEGEGQKVPLTARPPWKVGTSSINMPWSNTDGFVYTTSEVDLRGYDTLNFEMKIDNEFDAKRRKCGVRSSPPVSSSTDYTFLASVTLPNAATARKTYSVDIRSVSNGYVTIKGAISAVAYNIWAE